MNEKTKFVVLTSPSVSAGTILAYLLKFTSIQIASIYIETDSTHRGASQIDAERWFSSFQMVLRHGLVD